jgi:hypothetical protein
LVQACRTYVLWGGSKCRWQCILATGKLNARTRVSLRSVDVQAILCAQQRASTCVSGLLFKILPDTTNLAPHSHALRTVWSLRTFSKEGHFTWRTVLVCLYHSFHSRDFPGILNVSYAYSYVHKYLGEHNYSATHSELCIR